MIKGIAHLAFSVNDMAASLKFYTEILGGKHKFTLRGEDGTPWIEYVEIVPRQFIELFYHQGAFSTAPKSYQHLCLEVVGIQGLVESLRQKGVVIDHEVILGLDFNYQAWIHDPDGNPIELMEYTDKSLQLKG